MLTLIFDLSINKTTKETLPLTMNLIDNIGKILNPNVDFTGMGFNLDISVNNSLSLSLTRRFD